MQLIFSKERERLYQAITDILMATIAEKPNALLGLATGATFEPVYKEILKRSKQMNWNSVKTVNLDEYFPIERHAEQSFYTYMKTRLFDPLGLTEAQTLVLNGNAIDAEAECEAFEKHIDDLGGIDLQLLGIGRNGHIGFNEPADAFEPFTHFTTLSQTTIADNMRYFKGAQHMPTGALTMGTCTIMKAKRIILLAVGRSKGEALKALIDGKITPNTPASILKVHPYCTVFIDAEAGEALDWTKGTIL